jgi:nucleotide-binding universal stress UspA family protein
MKIDDVMLATDFSPASEPAAAFARDFAAQVGARLHVVHVISLLSDEPDAPERMARLAKQGNPQLRVETALLSGRAVPEIIRYARDKHIGLIVLGTHGRTGWSHALLGSVAEGIVRLAPCPVLTVPVATVTPAGAVPESSGATAPHRCIVCGNQTQDLICETCRARIRGEALGQRLAAERPGRRGSSV